MLRDKLRPWVNIVALLVVLVMNGLANALPLNGQTTGEISDRFDVYFVPAGYVFSIWGVIYLGLVGFAVYQVLPQQRDNPRLRGMSYLFALSSLANVLWLVAWHYERFVLSVAIMLVLLVSLIAIYMRLGIGQTVVPAAERWLVRVPFSIYLGWITVATIANVTSTLEYVGWNGWGLDEQLWAVIMIAVGWLIATAMAFSRRDVAYGLVIVWAYVGIAAKFPAVPVVSYAAGAGALLVIVSYLLVVLGTTGAKPLRTASG
ncbi:MAG: tryptophan-rich sensory protein [Chloroflexi bacterium]|nr:tryptophan-rich sensory protein [Chloroflexota bacterium]